jgi:hypothetical protein
MANPQVGVLTGMHHFFFVFFHSINAIGRGHCTNYAALASSTLFTGDDRLQAHQLCFNVAAPPPPPFVLLQLLP